MEDILLKSTYLTSSETGQCSKKKKKIILNFTQLTQKTGSVLQCVKQ